MEIKGKAAVVTGAGSGIGKSVAEELARRGVDNLAMVDLSPVVEEVAQSLRGQNGKGPKVEAFVGDVTDDAFRRKVFDHLVASGEVPAICVPAAGIARDALSVRLDKATGSAVLYPIADFRKTMEINLVSPVYWALEMVARIAENRQKLGRGRWGPPEHLTGTVIFIGSVSSQGNKGQISYAATKAGLEGAAATLMKEAIFYGVRCGVIHPGFTDTPMVRSLGQDYIDNRILPFTQLRRLIRTEEIADAICFMVNNSAVSGELWADAGWHPSA
jgi:NAD(P)-dependent dehydrogenase (short-subunit alcohol dehydrogenase family)